jgi:hypothetical protein
VHPFLGEHRSVNSATVIYMRSLHRRITSAARRARRSTRDSG